MQTFTRRALLLFAAITLAGSILSATSGPAAAEEEVKLELTEVGEGVYMIVGKGGNIGLCVGEDAPFVIDDQFAPLTDQIVAKVAEVSDKKVEFVLNTHWHADHTGGNENFGKAGAKIIAHDNVRVRLAKGGKRGNGSEVPPATSDALPVITFSDTTTFHWNAQDIHVFHVENAHTDGDSVVHFRTSNVIHTGDVFFNGAYPFIDIASGGSVDGYLSAQKEILDLADAETSIIPGHGPKASKKELEKAHEVLKEARERIGNMVEDGKSEEEVVAADPMGDYHAEWGQGFINGERLTRSVYQSLSK